MMDAGVTCFFKLLDNALLSSKSAFLEKGKALRMLKNAMLSFENMAFFQWSEGELQVQFTLLIVHLITDTNGFYRC